jgi:hypothetical protein
MPVTFEIHPDSPFAQYDDDFIGVGGSVASMGLPPPRPDITAMYCLPSTLKPARRKLPTPVQRCELHRE